MSLVTLKEILAPANEKNYAVAAFDTMDFTLTEGIIEAAEQTGLPVILMLPGFAFDRQEADAFLDFNLKRPKLPSAITWTTALPLKNATAPSMPAVPLSCLMVPSYPWKRISRRPGRWSRLPMPAESAWKPKSAM